MPTLQRLLAPWFAMLLAAIVTVAPSPGLAAAGTAEGTFEDCDMTLAHEIQEGQTRLRPDVPAAYELQEVVVPGSTGVILWFFRCDGGTAGGEAIAAFHLALVGVHIQNPGGAGGTWLLTHSEFYLVHAHTDAPALAAALASAGLPAAYVPGMTFARTAAPPTEEQSAAVPWDGGAYGFDKRTYEPDPPHFHDNAWWHPASGGEHAKLRVRIDDAIDKSCRIREFVDEPSLPLDCGDVWAEPGSTVAHLFAAPGPAGAFDHLGLDVAWSAERVSL